MKICFCDNSLKDLINFRGDIIHHFASMGDEINLIAPVNCDYIPPFKNISIIPIALSRSGMNPIKDFRYFIKLVSIYKKEKPDYIFHYTIKPNIYGSLAARILKTPSTAMIAGLGYIFTATGIKPWIGRMLYKFAMRFPQHILVLNEYNRKLLNEKRIGQSERIILLKGGEGINLKSFNPSIS